VQELDRLLWDERALFTWLAFLYHVEDWPLVADAGSRFPDYEGIDAWLRDNAAFERYVLATLKSDGPTPQSELEDRSVRPWESTGWTHGKNVSQLLEFLWAQGKVLVAARRGQERVWDLAERIVPPAPPLSRPTSRMPCGRGASSRVARTAIRRAASTDNFRTEQLSHEDAPP
jgi:uncharacterized protein YcaQ